MNQDLETVAKWANVIEVLKLSPVKRDGTRYIISVWSEHYDVILDGVNSEITSLAGLEKTMRICYLKALKNSTEEELKKLESPE